MNKLFYLYTFILSVFSISLTAQIYVPFRVGDKFGISDDVGKIIMQPEYDDIEVMNNGNFIAFKKDGNNYKKSFILKNKVVLENTDCDYFHEEHGFIVAARNNPEEIYSSNSQTAYLYSNDGRKVFESSFRYFVFIEENIPVLKDEILILTNDKDGHYSLILLHKKTLKIAKTYFENAVIANIDYEDFPKKLIVNFVLARETKLNRLILELRGGKVTNSTKKTILDEKNSEKAKSLVTEYRQLPSVISEQYPEEEIKKTKITNLVSLIKEGKIYKKYWESNIQGKLQFEEKKITPENNSLVKINGKWGFFNNAAQRWIISPEYDEIFYQESQECLFCHDYVVRKNNLYQFLEKDYGKPDFTSFWSEYYPILFKKHYGIVSFYLFKMYDKEGHFVCYANGKGRVYYSKD